MIRGGVVAAFVGGGLLVGACTPTHSTMARYRDHPALARLLADDAARRCARRRGAANVPFDAFTTDACSMSPDGDWGECCVEHDIVYWCGGSATERREADRRLAECVIAGGHSRAFAGLVHAAVRVGGAPWEPFPWRWGYGHPGLGAYEGERVP